MRSKTKINKYLKNFFSILIIFSMMIVSYASLSAADGSAFVTKGEFDSALADFNSRLTTFEAGVNSKIDSQVTSYLERNGIWSAQNQKVWEQDLSGTVEVDATHNVIYVWDSPNAFGLDQITLPTKTYWTQAGAASAAAWRTAYSSYSSENVYVGPVLSRWMATSGGEKGSLAYYGFLTGYNKSKYLKDGDNDKPYAKRKCFVANKSGMAWIEWECNKNTDHTKIGITLRDGSDFNIDHVDSFDIGVGFSINDVLKARVSYCSSSYNWMNLYQKVGLDSTTSFHAVANDGGAFFPLQSKYLKCVTMFFLQKGDQVDISQWPLKNISHNLDLSSLQNVYYTQTKQKMNAYINKCVVY